jgi:hypothetical protein
MPQPEGVTEIQFLTGLYPAPLRLDMKASIKGNLIVQ